MKFNLVSDHFNEATLDAIWEELGVGKVAFTNQKLNVLSSITANTAGIKTASGYDLTDSQVSVKLLDATAQDLASLRVLFQLLNTTTEEELYFEVVGGVLNASKKTLVDAVLTTAVIATATYNSTNHKYFRIYERSGTIYFDTSANGLAWTNFASVATPFDITGLKLFLGIINGIELLTETALFDDFNRLPAATQTGKHIQSPEQILSLTAGLTETRDMQFVIATQRGISPTNSQSVQKMLNNIQGLADTDHSEQECFFDNLKSLLSLTGNYTDYSIQEMLALARNAGLTINQMLGIA